MQLVSENEKKKKEKKGTKLTIIIIGNIVDLFANEVELLVELIEKKSSKTRVKLQAGNGRLVQRASTKRKQYKREKEKKPE